MAGRAAALARLHVLLARDSRQALVIRHGTAKSVCTLGWDRSRDRFKLGQWMRGRIEPGLCDLSPCGAHFIYTARKYSAREGTTIGWTVVSRAPYLKAVAYYPACWSGGWFLDDTRYVLGGPRLSEQDRESREVALALAPAEGSPLRDGWRRLDRPRLERDLRHGWVLEHDPRWQAMVAYRLRRGDRVLDLGGWEWADLDRDRLVWTKDGCLWTARLKEEGLGKPECLYDFNGMKYEAIAAPYEGGQPVDRSVVAAKPPRGPLKQAPRRVVRRKPARGRVRENDE